jgi:transcriptional regulator with XRE-family HTH domain
MKIEERIKDLCYDHKMTIPQLAEKIGMSSSFYSTLKRDSLKVSTLIKIAEVFEVPVSMFFEPDCSPAPTEIQLELEVAKANLAELNKSYSELKAKYDNLFELKTLNENLVESMRKDMVKNDKLMYLAYVQIHGLQAIAEKHIITSILAAHPEIDEIKDTELLQKHINKDPFSKEFKIALRLMEPLVINNLDKFMEDEHVFDEL